MATISYGGAKPFSQYRGSGVGVGEFVNKGFEAASQTYKQGALLKLVSGLLTAIADGTSLTNALKIAGMANEDASGTTNTEREFTAFDRSREYWVPVVTSAGALKAGDRANIGATFCGYLSATYGVCVDTDTTTNPCFVVTGIVTGQTPWGAMAATDTGVLYRVKFLDSALSALGVI